MDTDAMLASTFRSIGGDLRTDLWRLVVSTEPGSFLGGPALGPVANGIDEIQRLILGVADDLDRAAAEIESGGTRGVVVCPPGPMR